MLDALISFFISMVPVFELRGGIVFAAARGIPFLYAFLICLLGNILPIPFILLFTRRVFLFLEHIKPTEKFVKRFENKARSKQSFLRKYEWFGLFLFVAIPLPGTGAWTGAMIAALLDMQIKRAFPALALGVFGAGIIMSVISFVLPGLFFSVQ